jgi:hypothetical protein
MVLAGGSGCGAAGGSMPMGLEPSSGACSEWRAREVEATPRRKWIEEWEEYNAGGMVGFLGGRLSGPWAQKCDLGYCSGKVSHG